MNKKYLPSKKFMKITIGTLVLLVVLYFIILYAKTYKSLKNPIITTSTVQVQELFEKDTDTDGVRDWEEVLWGTDPLLVSTFNMSDREYIDNKKKEIASKNTEDVAPTQDLNDTEKLAREFLTTILTLKESGTLNSFNIETLATKFSADVGAETTITDSYKASDVRKGEDTAAAKKAYYTKFTAALSAAKKAGMGKELETIATFFSNEAADTKSLTAIANGYTTFEKTLANMTVPPSAAKLHLELLNESHNMAAVFKNVGQINDNSIIGLIAIAQYKKIEPTMEKTFTDFIAYFKSSGIIK